MASPRRMLAAVTLVLEAFVVLFAALVAKDLSGLSPAVALGAGGAAALGLALTGGLLRTRAGYPVGWGWQVVLILSGVWVPAMFIIGPVFALLWAASLHYGARIERERAAVADALRSRGDTPGG